MAINIDFRVKNGLAVTTTATIESTTQSLSTNTGALQVIGGAGIGQNLYVGGFTNVAGISTFTNVALSVSTNTGALQVIGGVGIGGNLYVGGDVNVAGVINASIVGIITTATNIANGTPGQILYQQSVGLTKFIQAGTTGNVLVSYGESSPIFQNTLTLAGTTNSTSTNSGAFQVAGGVGIVKDLWVGGTIHGNGSLTGLITTSTNIASGTAGQLVYQSASGVTAFAGPGTAGQLLMSSGTNAPLYIDTSSIYVGYSLNAITATNIIGGALGSIPYQNGTGTTAMLPLSTAGFFLLAGVSAPYWQDPANIFINTATNLARGTTGQIPFQVSTGSTNFFGPGTIGQVLVSAGASSTGPVFQNTLTLAGTTNATSTTTGALTVAGGVGIGNNLYVGGNLETTNDTFNLINTSATTVNFAGSGTSVNIGSATGTTKINNNLTIVGNLTVQGTSTVVDSTVTNITDPILTLGGLSNNQPLTTPDNKDKGIAFKYFSGSAKTGFFGFDDSTGFFTFVPTASITNEIVSGTKGALDAYIAGGTAQSLVYQSNPNITAFLAAGTGGNILQTNGTGLAPSWSNTLTLAGTTNSTSTNSGALQVVGGVGIGGNLYVGGITTITNTASSISTTTGALTVIGGVGIRGDVYVGGVLYATINGSITTASNMAKGNTGQILYQSTSGVTAFVGTGTAGQLLVSAGAVTTGPVFTNTASIYVGYADKSNTAITAVTSTNITAGSPGQILYQSSTGTTSFAGPGTAGQLLMSAGTNAPTYTNTASIYVGYADKANTAITATNIAAGGLGQLVYQSSTGTTAFVGTGTAGQVLVSAGTTSTGPIFQNTLTLAGTTSATSTLTGALTVAGGVGIGKDLYVGGNIYGTVTGSITTATNIENGSTGQLPIQSGAGKTSFVSTGSNGNLLQYNYSSLTNTATWVSTTSLYVGYADKSNTAITATNITAGTQGQIHYQSAPGVTAFAGPGTAGQLLVSAGTTSTGPIFQNTLTLAGTTSATSTITGALQVVGGVGIGGNLYVGGNIYGTVTGVITTATNITAGTQGQIPYQSAPGVTAFAGPGTAGQLLVSAGTTSTGPVFTNTASIYVGLSTSLAGGTLQSIHYQSNTGTTSFLAASTSGYILSTNGTGTPPTWINPSTLSPGGLTVQANVAAFEYVVGVGAAGSAQTAYIATTSSGQFGFNANSGFVGLGTTSPVSKLTVVETGGLASQIRIEGHENSGIAIVTPTYTQPGFVGYDGSGNIGIKQNNQTKGIYFSNYLGTNRLYITPNGGISFNGVSNYGSQYQILQSNGDSAPTWISVGALTAVNSATQVITVQQASNAVYYPTFVNANNASALAMSVYTTSSFVVNPGTGQIGIGTSSPTNKLQIHVNTTGTDGIQLNSNVGGGNVALRPNNSQGANNSITQAGDAGIIYSSSAGIGTGAFVIAPWASGTSGIRMNSSGYVGIATATPAFPLDVSGNARVTGNFTATGSLTVGVTTASSVAGEIRATNEITAYYTSDARLKENVQAIEDPITMIDQIRGVYFDWTDEHIASRGGEDGYFVRKHDIGVIAQEVEAILPEIVATRDNGFKAVKYEKIVPLLIEAIKAQQRQIDQIQSMLDQLINK